VEGLTFTHAKPGSPYIFSNLHNLTPERQGKCGQENQLAVKARDLVQTTLEQAQSITLKDVVRGKYFRIVASVEADGQDVSDLLIQEGLAVVYDGGTKGKEWCE